MIKYEVKVYANGGKVWYLNDKLHREDGPAIEYADGSKWWYLNDEELTEEEHHIRTLPTVKSDCLGENSVFTCIRMLK